MGVNRKVTQRPYGYLALDLHPAGDNSRHMFSHLFTHERCIRLYRRKVKIETNITLVRNHFMYVRS